MKEQLIDHALTTIGCMLDGMEAVIQMTMEVEAVSAEAIGYLLLGCIASIRQECDTIESATISAHNEGVNTYADD